MPPPTRVHMLAKHTLKVLEHWGKKTLNCSQVSTKWPEIKEKSYQIHFCCTWGKWSTESWCKQSKCYLVLEQTVLLHYLKHYLHNIALQYSKQNIAMLLGGKWLLKPLEVQAFPSYQNCKIVSVNEQSEPLKATWENKMRKQIFESHLLTWYVAHRKIVSSEA